MTLTSDSLLPKQQKDPSKISKLHRLQQLAAKSISAYFGLFRPGVCQNCDTGFPGPEPGQAQTSFKAFSFSPGNCGNRDSAGDDQPVFQKHANSKDEIMKDNDAIKHTDVGSDDRFKTEVSCPNAGPSTLEIIIRVARAIRDHLWEGKRGRKRRRKRTR